MLLISLVSSSAVQPLVERVCCAIHESARCASLSLQTSVKQKGKNISEKVPLCDFGVLDKIIFFGAPLLTMQKVVPHSFLQRERDLSCAAHFHKVGG